MKIFKKIMVLYHEDKKRLIILIFQINDNLN